MHLIFAFSNQKYLYKKQGGYGYTCQDFTRDKLYNTLHSANTMSIEEL